MLTKADPQRLAPKRGARRILKQLAASHYSCHGERGPIELVVAPSFGRSAETSDLFAQNVEAVGASVPAELCSTQHANTGWCCAPLHQPLRKYRHGLTGIQPFIPTTARRSGGRRRGRSRKRSSRSRGRIRPTATGWCGALTRRRLGIAVNRKRVLRVMREQGLIQRRRSLPRRKRPGFFRVERPGQLWHMDMTSVWVAEQGWCYLNAIIDCCTREIVGWGLESRCRAKEAIAVLEAALARSCFIPDELQVGDEAERLTLGTDNGSAFTSRAFKAVLAEHEVGHRRGGYRDPESQAFIESWFAKLKEREVWLNEYETLDDARRGIDRYVDRYHHRPHSGLDYRTPQEVRQTWEDLQKTAA